MCKNNLGLRVRVRISIYDCLTLKHSIVFIIKSYLLFHWEGFVIWDLFREICRTYLKHRKNHSFIFNNFCFVFLKVIHEGSRICLKIKMKSILAGLGVWEPTQCIYSSYFFITFPWFCRTFSSNSIFKCNLLCRAHGKMSLLPKLGVDYPYSCFLDLYEQVTKLFPKNKTVCKYDLSGNYIWEARHPSVH